MGLRFVPGERAGCPDPNGTDARIEARKEFSDLLAVYAQLVNMGSALIQRALDGADGKLGPALANGLDAAKPDPHYGGMAPGDAPALRMVAPPSGISAPVAAWLDYLTRHGRSEGTIKAWTNIIAADIREGRLVHESELNFDRITTLLSRLRESRGWSASTYRVHLSAWKSLDRHIKRVRDGDIQAAEGPMDDDTGMGERAATTDEARAHLAAAWEQEQKDGRAKSPRTIYTACLFLAGLREDEPNLWRWEHLKLDGPTPFIAWTSNIQKNKRRQNVAICPELGELLRAWRDATYRDDPEGKVFAYKPPRDVFRKDRRRAGIIEADERGRRYAPRSARKWLKTTLAILGVEKDWSELFMRHAGLAQRYFDATPEQQAPHLSTLPRLLPDTPQAIVNGTLMKSSRKSAKKHWPPLAVAGVNADTDGVTTESAMHPETNRIPTHATQRIAQPVVTNEGEGRDSARFGPANQAASLDAVNGRFPRASADADRLADLLESVAKFLRAGGVAALAAAAALFICMCHRAWVEAQAVYTTDAWAVGTQQEGGCPLDSDGHTPDCAAGLLRAAIALAEGGPK